MMKKSMIRVITLTTVVFFIGCSPKNELNKKSASTLIQSSSTKNTVESTTKEYDLPPQNYNFNVSVNQVIEQYNEMYPETMIISVELEQSVGTRRSRLKEGYYYTIEGVDDINEYKVKINSETGEIKTEAKFDKEDQKQQDEVINSKNLLSIEEVSSLAEKTVGEGKSQAWKLEQDLGITYWEVRVENGTKDFKVKINAQTGEVIDYLEY